MIKLTLRTMLMVALIAALACATNPVPAAPEPTRAIDTPGARSLPSTGSCLDDHGLSPRPRDPAAHIYDTAVWAYLNQNASSFGRKPRGDEEQKALAVTDDYVHQLCIQRPENCLRQQFAQVQDKAQMANLIHTTGSYAYNRAVSCLNREGEDYQDFGRPELYDERIATHLVGAVQPVGLLRETNLYRSSDRDRVQDAEAAWQSCYDALPGRRSTDAINARVDDDMSTAVDCADTMIEAPDPPLGSQTHPRRPANGSRIAAPRIRRASTGRTSRQRWNY